MTSYLGKMIMAYDTGIEWCNHTFNPWWGCTKLSQGCKHCYAETMSARFGQDIWGPGRQRRTFAEKHWHEPLKWDALAAATNIRARVFCASMADVFEDNRQLNDERTRLWHLIEETPHLDWLLLTKRPHLIAEMVPSAWLTDPRENVWYGTSVESPEVYARLDALRHTPAVVRFVSAEPLLAPLTDLDLAGLHWVIAGGESGSGARPMDEAWVRLIRDQFQAAGVAFFMKQMGAVWARTHAAHSKGGNLDDLPPDLQIREFPQPLRVGTVHV